MRLGQLELLLFGHGRDDGAHILNGRGQRKRSCFGIGEHAGARGLDDVARESAQAQSRAVHEAELAFLDGRDRTALA